MVATERIGWIGLGSLGQPCVHRFASLGIKPRVWARDKQVRAEFVANGFCCEPSAQDLAAKVDCVFLCLSDEPAIEQVVFGENGVAAGLRRGSLVIDCSTIHPETTRKLAARLRKLCDCEWVDAPVSGGAGHVANGELLVLAGGSEAALEKAALVMKPLYKRFTRLGPVGSGQTLKACVQLVTGATVQALAEGLSVIKAAGLDPETAIATMGESLADSQVLKLHGPRLLDLLAGVEPQAFPTHPRVMRKDLGIAASLGDDKGFSMPLASLIADLYQALEDQGLPEEGQIGLLRLLQSRS